VQAVGNPRQRSELIEKDSQMSIRRQCRLLHIHRSLVYYDLSGETIENLELMKKLDHNYLEDPSSGSRRHSSYLSRQTGKATNRKRVRRLMRKMGVEAIYPRKRTTIPGGPSGIYPYRLKGLKISRPNQVWCADITFIPMRKGFMYLFAIIDWYSRKIIDWELSNTLDVSFCLICLQRAIKHSGTPEIMNTDQGSQFTSDEWIMTRIGIKERRILKEPGKARQYVYSGRGVPAEQPYNDLHSSHIRLAAGRLRRDYYESARNSV